MHTEKAVEYGATLEEISEAMGVAIALNASAALVYSARVIEAHTQLPNTEGRLRCAGRSSMNFCNALITFIGINYHLSL